MTSPSERIVVSGVGLLSAVGFSVEASCASLRAGIVRASEIDELPLGDGFAVGHRISDVADGFVHTGFWVRAGALALRDMLRNGVVPVRDGDFWKRTIVVGVAPVIAIDRFADTLEPMPDALVDCFVAPMIDVVGLPVVRSQLTGFANGHAGAAEAVELAVQQIRSGRCRRAVVVGVESYLDPTSLQWLADAGRLKSADQPVGLMPGQAAAAVLLEAAEEARRRGVAATAQIAGVAVVRDAIVPDGEPMNIPRAGAALARAIRQALSTPPPKTCRLILDLNGETWRAKVWGHAQVHLQEHWSIDGWPTTVPAESFGEIGAASGLAGICVAVQSIVRGYAHCDVGLVCSLSESGLSGAISVANADGSR